MYCSYLGGKDQDGRMRRLACVFVFSLGYGWTQAAAEVLPANMLASASSQISADSLRSHMRLLPSMAAGSDLDDCDPLPPAAAAQNDAPVLVAKAEIAARSPRNVPAPAQGSSVALVDTGPLAPAAAPVAIAPPAPIGRDWEIFVADKTLNATLARWAASTGWQLLWELPVDYAVEANTRLHGTFEEAVAVVARSMESAQIPMKAVFYQGNKVLRITAKGSE
mgnify:CR=1 FL=1